MEEEHPPKARMAIRVGVTGHRLKALEDAGFDESLLRASIREILIRIRDTATQLLRENQDVYAHAEPLLRVISPLAEGSDRLVAEEGLKLGYELQSPLPFPPEEYENDFTLEPSKSDFRALLKKSTATFILDGSPQCRNPAYEAVGRIVLRESDVLIAIWNGKGAKGQGGSGQIVKESLSRKTPTLWITSDQPHSISLLEKVSEDGTAASWRSLDEIMELRGPKPEKIGLLSRIKRALLPQQSSEIAKIKAFDSRLRSILAPPSSPEQVKMLHRFLIEKQPQFRAALLYRIFCKAFVSCWGVPKREVESFEDDRRQEWLDQWSLLPDPNTSVGTQIEQSYRLPFVWADVIADICADRYRSSFVATYLLGALAVLAAFLGSHPKDLPRFVTSVLSDVHGWFFAELVFIGGILLLVRLNKLCRWYERWIDYRLLAEGLRQMRALAPFARVTPSFEVPPHLSEDAPSSTWFNWYFRAVVRGAGLVRATVNSSYLEFCRGVLRSEITSQVRYHIRNARRHDALHRRLHKLSLALFILTLIACVAHLSFKPEEGSTAAHYVELSLTLCAIVLPAFGAAIQGILHQGEFGRLERRSRALKNSLQKLRNQVKVSDKELSFRDLGRDTESFSQIQMLEQADWRSVFIIKDISLP